MKRTLERIAATLSFLTVLPVPGKREVSRSSAFFPIAGWIIGGALFGVMAAAESLPVLASTFLVVAVWEFASRGLHVDALADSADAFLAGGGRERILRILEDSHTGAFGVMAIGLLLLGKFALVSSLPVGTGRVAVLCACVVGRFGLTVFAALFGAARDEGLGSAVIRSTGLPEVAVAAVIAFVPLGIIFRMQALYAACGLLPGLALALYSWKKIGGLTGDVLGACLELTELATLFAFLFI